MGNISHFSNINLGLILLVICLGVSGGGSMILSASASGGSGGCIMSAMLAWNYATDNYLFKVNKKTLEQGVKYIQS